MRTFIMVLTLLLGSAGASAFDCTAVKLPSSLVICGDPELMRLADERQQAFDQAVARLDGQQQKELLADQTGWVRSYATACGVPPDRTPPSPVPDAVKNCFKRAAQARIAYIRAYAAQDGGASPPSAPSAAAVASPAGSAEMPPPSPAASASSPRSTAISGPTPPIGSSALAPSSEAAFTGTDITKIVDASQHNEAKFNRDFKGKTFSADGRLEKIGEGSLFSPGSYRIQVIVGTGQVDCTISDASTVTQLPDWRAGSQVRIVGQISTTVMGDLQLDKGCTVERR